MLNQNAKKWLEALRSGKYEQGKYVLCSTEDGDRFCCLGVACDVYKQTHPEFKVYTNDEGNRKFGESDEVLPSVVKEWLGLDTDTGAYKETDGDTRALTTDNDERDLDFEAIARIIESEPDGLFTKPSPDTSTSEPVQS